MMFSFEDIGAVARTVHPPPPALYALIVVATTPSNAADYLRISPWPVSDIIVAAGNYFYTGTESPSSWSLAGKERWD
jgi:hypothetical protein